MGIGTAGLIIAGASMVYPMTGTNLAGHILGWILAGFVGIKITLSAIDDEESWLEGTLQVAEEAPQAAAIEVKTRRETLRSASLEHRGRTSWKPKEEPVLEYPGRLGRDGRVVAGTLFHRPDRAEREECIRFAAENPICSLATVDEEDAGRPHVRTVFLWRADESGFYFVLFSSKSVSRQVKAHPEVELCFQNHPGDISEAKQLRLHGHLDLLKNHRLQEEASRDRSILNTLSGDGKDASLEVYLLSDYEMKFWQMGAMAQKVRAHTAVC